MSDSNAKCDDCGQFMNPDQLGSSFAYIYDMVHCTCEYEHWRCHKCTAKLGPKHSNAKPYNGDMSPYESQKLEATK